MKKFTLLLISALLVGGVHAQVLDSDFSDWDSGLPVGWVGAKTNLDVANILQADNDGGQGDYAVELMNTESGHKRFTTQPMSVEAGQSYDITFWTRGTGEIRTGLFDEREDGSGYVYNTYVSVNSVDWEQYTQSLIAETNSNIAEFILSVRNTAGDINVQIDRVLIETGEIDVVTIYDIQYTEAGDGASPFEGQSVTTGGVVTASDSSGFFIQNGGGQWSGIYVFSPFNMPDRGDSVIFTGNVVEYFDLTQISGLSGFTTVNTGNELVITDVSTGDANTEEYESTLVKVWDANVTDGNTGFGQFEVNDGSGALLVNPDLYEYDGVTGETYNITGVIFYSFDEYKIMPRDADDVEFSTSVQEISANDGISVYPNPASDVVNLNWISGISGNISYNLFDVKGRLVNTGTIARPLGTVNVSNLTPGLYTLNLVTEEGVKYTRLMIER